MYSRISLAVFFSLVAVFVTGCFSSRPADINAFLKPYQVNVTTDKYILEPPDEIEVHCTKVPEINLQRQRIRPDGRISFETLGDVVAAGKTPEELKKELQQKAEQLYTLVGEGPVDVRLIAYQSKFYYVLGQVYLPGPKVYTGRDSVLYALAAAQPNPMAWLERVQVIRPSSNKTEKPKIFELNFDRMMAHGDGTKDVLLQEGDVIYVPPTILASIALKVEEVIRPVARAFSGVNIVESGGQRQVSGYGNPSY